MTGRQGPELEQQLLYRVSSASSEDRSREYETEDEVLAEKAAYLAPPSRLPRWLPYWATRGRRTRAGYFTLNPGRRRRSLPVRILQLFALFPYLVICLILVFGIFLPSYTKPPQHYQDLRQAVEQYTRPGRGNVANERVFIAASIYDRNGELLRGNWGARLKELVEILGPNNVYLSIYENDPDTLAQAALESFGETITCNKSMVSEHLDLATLPHVVTPTGASRLKRIAFLAEVRNRALRPLEDPGSSAYATQYDKLLYLNDVVFDPIEAANLLFSTNIDGATKKTDYRAACAVDFINPFKFYDTFATRDTEGYRMGVPFYPWFTSSGSGESRQDVLDQKDAVRVKSCWGGMVAFEAKWFQPHMHKPTSAVVLPANLSTEALRFRAEPDTYWDGSECCLIHADLAHTSSLDSSAESSGIYMNPYVRVAYDYSTLKWLPFTRRFERLYGPIQSLINALAHMPGYNPRRTQQPGDRVIDKVWVWDEASRAAMKEGRSEGLHGSFQSVERVATPGQYCGFRNLLYINEHPEEGEGKWGFETVPAVN